MAVRMSWSSAEVTGVKVVASRGWQGQAGRGLGEVEQHLLEADAQNGY
jgi:hypothetical protein